MKVRDILGKPEFVIKEQNCPDFVLPKCNIGLEYEWEQVSRFPMLKTISESDDLKKFRGLFATHNDGSLRNGVEFVCNGPKAGTQLLAAVDLMDEISRMYEFKSSYRTSLHVHLDMSEVKIPEDVTAFGQIYCLVEPLLYKFVGKNRSTSNYCIPWFAHPQHYQTYFDTYKAYSKTGMPAEYLANGLVGAKQYKYSGLNLFSLGEYGTIEFRQAPVDMQLAKIKQWINIIMSMKKYIVDNKNVDVLARVHRLGNNGFIEEVFQGYSSDLLKYATYPDFRKGLATLYHFTSLA